MKSISRGNPKSMKRLNKSLILNIVRMRQPVSRSEIVAATNLSLGAVYGLTKELIDEALLQMSGLGDIHLGRKPILLELDLKHKFVVGINVQKIVLVEGAVADLGGNIISELKLRLVSTDVSTVVTSICKLIRDLATKCRLDLDSIMGVGIAAPGIVEPAAGRIVYSAHLGWKDIPFGTMVAEQFPFQVVLDSDNHVLALGEMSYGAAKGVKDLLYIVIGPGVGATIVMDGRIRRGVHGFAGEFGHITVDREGPKCVCGRRGCIETFVAESSIARRARKGVVEGRKTLINELSSGKPDKISAEIVYKATSQNDKFAREVIEETGYYLGIGLANLVNLFDPELIVLEGNIVGDLLLKVANKTVLSNLVFRSGDEVRIIPASLGEKAGVVGAIALILQHVFEVPVISRTVQ